MKTTFRYFLEEKCFAENPTILDDDMPDFFDGWVSDLQADEFMDYGEEYSQKLVFEEKKKLMEVMEKQNEIMVDINSKIIDAFK